MAFPKIEGYVVTEKLGSGSYSTVYKAYAKVGARSIVAVKCVDKSRIKNSGSAVDNLITEIRLLKTLEHPHIVHMKHFTWDDKNIYIIMEYCCGGDLSRYIQRYGRVPEKQVLYFLQQLASALKFLREKDVVHMDLKPHNLLLHKGSDGKYILKVADFGFAQYLCSSSPRGVRGSPLYMAPEMLLGKYDARVDLWSVGVIMYECLFGRAPYASNTFKELVDKIERNAKIQIPPNSSISPGCRDLLTRLLKHNPDERISYEEFFSHEYLDLEHMPSKENYEKAVSLIKLAIECDASGRSRDAFNLYRDALRYLVPAVTAETDSVRRGALAAKLNRYMERAEELKLYLKCGEQSIPTYRSAGAAAPTVPAGAPTCCGTSGTTSTSSYEYGHIQVPICANCACIPGVGRNSSTEQCNCTDSMKRDNTVEEIRMGEPIEEKGVTIEPPPASANAASANTNANVRSRTPTRFGLKRLFGKQNSMPYLTNNDSSITGRPPEKQKVPVDDSTSDGCRIS